MHPPFSHRRQERRAPPTGARYLNPFVRRVPFLDVDLSSSISTVCKTSRSKGSSNSQSPGEIEEVVVNRSGKMGWTALGMVLAFDVAAVLALAPVAKEAQRGQVRVVLDAGKAAARHAASWTQRETVRWAGAGLILVAKSATRVFAAMSRVTPRQDAVPAGVGSRRAVTTVSKVECPGMAGPCKQAEPKAAAPARFYSQTL
jgi:hypothetical protein